MKRATLFASFVLVCALVAVVIGNALAENPTGTVNIGYALVAFDSAMPAPGGFSPIIIAPPVWTPKSVLSRPCTMLCASYPSGEGDSVPMS